MQCGVLVMEGYYKGGTDGVGIYGQFFDCRIALLQIYRNLGYKKIELIRNSPVCSYCRIVYCLELIHFIHFLYTSSLPTHPLSICTPGLLCLVWSLGFLWTLVSSLSSLHCTSNILNYDIYIHMNPSFKCYFHN